MPSPGSSLFPSGVVFPSIDEFFVTGGDGDSDGADIILGPQHLTQTDVNGVQWFVLDPLAGWDGSPASSLSLTQKTRAPGAWTGPRNLTARSITLSGMIAAPTVATAVAALDRLSAAAALDATVLTVARTSQARSAIVYRQGLVDITALTDTTFGYTLDLVCPDPRKFTAAYTASTAQAAVSGGFTIPFTIPFTIDSTVVSGNVSLTNPGNATGPVVLRIDGPVTGPQVTHVGSGLQLVFASSLALGPGEWIEVDMEAQTALANGQASRSAYITSRGWSGFDPGDNGWAFTAVSGSGLMTVTATPAWM